MGADHLGRTRVSDGDVPHAAPHVPPSGEISPEDLAAMEAMGMPGPEGSLNKGSLRRKLFVAILIAGVGVGASIMSCVGQSFSLRQARAMEGIEQQLKEIHAICTVVPRSESAR
jgi:hypothetical protein